MLCSFIRSFSLLLLLLLSEMTVAVEVPIFPNDAAWYLKASNIAAGDVLLFNEGINT